MTILFKYNHIKQLYRKMNTIDSQTGILSKESAICVQRFDDSRNSAIHITYRISLRSSSLREPRDPLPKVVLLYFVEAFQHSTGLLFQTIWYKTVV